MNMDKNDARSTIAALVDDLEPVRAMRRRDGWLLLAMALGGAVALVALWYGLREGLMTGDVSPLFLITNGLLLLLGLATGTAVMLMASPQVGTRHDGPKWAMAMVALLPLAAVVVTLAQGTETSGLWFDENHDGYCLLRGIVLGVVVGAVQLLWLRRGAPVGLARAGLYLGTSAGALGSFAYGLACAQETMNHLGIWHVAPVAVCALIGRFAVPPLLRW